MNPAQWLIRYGARPLRPGALGVIVVFDLAFGLASMAGLTGLWLGVIVTSWFWKYAFILFDTTVNGVEEPPALDIQAMNPIDEQRPLALLGLLVLAGLGLWRIKEHWGLSMAIAPAVVLLAVLPAVTAVLAVERNFLKALNPLLIARLVKELGALYFALLAAVLLFAGAIALLAHAGTPSLITQGLAMYGALASLSLLAGALYERRHELGLEVAHAPEITAARDARAARAQDQATIDDAYGLVRVGRAVDAWNTIQAWLDTQPDRFVARAWLCACSKSWTDPRFWQRLNEDRLEELLAAHRSSDALRAIEEALRHDTAFKPKTAESTLRLASLAAEGGAPGAARKLLDGFEEKFAGATEIKGAAALRQRVSR